MTEHPWFPELVDQVPPPSLTDRLLMASILVSSSLMTVVSLVLLYRSFR